VPQPLHDARPRVSGLDCPRSSLLFDLPDTHRWARGFLAGPAARHIAQAADERALCGTLVERNTDHGTSSTKPCRRCMARFQDQRQGSLL
jgi:hypothetical protein